MKFHATAEVTISVVAEVEDALEKLQEMTLPTLCHFCCEAGGGEEWQLNGDLDGEPLNIKIERA